MLQAAPTAAQVSAVPLTLSEALRIASSQNSCPRRDGKRVSHRY
ncbi:hypothetical protein MA5S0422_0564 [Mycobacteroides abscessus 5S-0422]|uniref:Uncharacterized protein n=1 Tax=Mycobacteroides abscessus subsp. bolletii 1513 TaxID=1299321 RepID=X8E2X8_9MYCO|nr:hypothetical protein MA5S0421_5395 [Mycobacteroides abscessus 5S-0421]EIU19322.1 hypothetical protein MA5S0422_0564 [Mycobacteroides abscessus 5S-0422]EIU34217.1 hypothetical protein MA5S0708_0473 [Mycobacteroides abscessus 5S-0708]EIV01656.1 hypothetical protein MA5S0921_0665 [Mycobacteroides abscessus 5S-0921]EUA74195.1 hypothetical protein I540_0606 [Mycobacteroides abscessus subsp. bolletii 1513]